MKLQKITISEGVVQFLMMVDVSWIFLIFNEVRASSISLSISKKTGARTGQVVTFSTIYWFSIFFQRLTDFMISRIESSLVGGANFGGIILFEPNSFLINI